MAVFFICTQLGKMRYATVCEFRGRKMVNIREYYEADGETKPGRKGWLDVFYLSALINQLHAHLYHCNCKESHFVETNRLSLGL